MCGVEQWSTCLLDTQVGLASTLNSPEHLDNANRCEKLLVACRHLDRLKAERDLIALGKQQEELRARLASISKM